MTDPDLSFLVLSGMSSGSPLFTEISREEVCNRAHDLGPFWVRHEMKICSLHLESILSDIRYVIGFSFF
jgi:hypothetical protein